MASNDGGSFSIRQGKAGDLEEIAATCFTSFKVFNESVGIPIDIDFPSLEQTTEIMRNLMGHKFFVVAVDDRTGLILGTGFLSQEPEVCALGPIAVHPDRSNKGVGKAITTSLINRAEVAGAKSIRLLQAAPNTKSFSLYSVLGFEAKECFGAFRGTISSQQAEAASSKVGFGVNANADVRLMKDTDAGPCAELFKKARGYNRSGNIQEFMGPNSWVLSSESGILAYTTGFYQFGHTVALSEEAFVTLLTGILSQAKEPQQILLNLPTRLCPKLARWAFAAKFTLIRHVWYMVIGEYQASPDGSVYCTSVLH